MIIGQLSHLLGIEPSFRVQVREKRVSEDIVRKPSYIGWALFNLGHQEAAGPSLQSPVEHIRVLSAQLRGVNLPYKLYKESTRILFPPFC